MTQDTRSTKRNRTPRGISRRTFLARSGAALAGAAGVATLRPRIAVAAPVTLSIWTGEPELETFYKRAGEEYAKTHPGFKLETLSTELRGMEQKITAAVPTDTGPDLFDISRNIALSLIDANLLPPNPPAVMALVKSAFHPVTVEYNTWKGQVYGVPFLEYSGPALFYNTKMFKEAGLDPNKPPATFDELMAYAQKLTKRDAAGNPTRAGITLRLVGQGSGIAQKFGFILYAMGGDTIVQTKSGKWHNNYDNDAGRAAMKYYIDAVYKYRVDDQKLPRDTAAFVSEQAAMHMRESDVIGTLKEKGPKVEYMTAPLPRGPKRWGVLTQPESIYVTKGKNMEAAWDFAQFLVSPPMALQLTREAGFQSLRSDMDWTPLLKETPQFKTFVQLPKGQQLYTEPALPVFDELQTKMADRLVTAYADKSLLDNPAGIAKTMKDIAAESDELLKKAGVYGTE
jgi:multiple sugar transport system substrate-binding protein